MVANDPANPTPPPPVAGDPETALEHYEKAVVGLRAGLLDMEASPSFLMLTSDELGPVTASKVGAGGGAKAASDLWAVLQAIDSALEHIRERVDTEGLKGKNRHEVVELLSTRWVDVAGSGSPLRSIGELLAAVRKTYDDLRPHVTEIDQLWLTILPRLDAAKATLTRLDAEVDQLGVPEPLIGRAKALVSDLEQRLVSDPLSVVIDDGDQLDAQVAEAARQVSSMRASRESLDSDAAGTEELLASLRVLRARAAALAQESRAKVLDPPDLIQVPSVQVLDGPGGLGARLDQFMAVGQGASWNQRRGLLDSWLATARRLEDQLESAIEVNAGPLRRRDELRGRVRAYQAKISAVGKAEDLDLTAMVDDVRASLYTAPADLERASTTIEELARKLRS
ncbi:MAG: hypothetical protein GY724_08825 [Actinomycetia bacterium]|nr:hypothetical protein [Actinomycetes bacterium]